MKVYTFSVLDDGTIAVESFDTYEQARVHCWGVACESQFIASRGVTSGSQFIAIVEDGKTRWFRKVGRLTLGPKPVHLIPDAIVDRLEDVMLSDELQTIVDDFSSVQ